LKKRSEQAKGNAGLNEGKDSRVAARGMSSLKGSWKGYKKAKGWARSHGKRGGLHGRRKEGGKGRKRDIVSRAKHLNEIVQRNLFLMGRKKRGSLSLSRAEESRNASPRQQGVGVFLGLKGAAGTGHMRSMNFGRDMMACGCKKLEKKRERKRGKDRDA